MITGAPHRYMVAFPAGNAGVGRRAFTLVEVIVSMGIVAVLLVSAMRVSATVGLNRQKNEQRAIAAALADDMIAQISVTETAAAGTPPVSGGGLVSGLVSGVLNLLAGVTNTLPVVSEIVPTAPTEPVSDWSRTVAVEWVRTDTPTVVSASATGLRRITVTVLFKNAMVLQRVAYRATDLD